MSRAHQSNSQPEAPHPTQEPRRGFTATLLKVAAVLFLAEFAVMSFLPLLGLQGMWESVADSLVLAMLALPALYALGFSPGRLIETDRRRHTRLERRMLALLVGNVVMVLLVIAVYGLLASGQQSGSRVINVAGRQRMLSQRLVEAAMFEAMELAHAERADREPRMLGVIPESSAQVEGALRGLVEGDAELGLPRCASGEVARQLEVVGAAWKPLRALLVRTSEPSSMDEASAYYGTLQRAGDRLLAEMEKAVTLLEKHYEGRAKLLSAMLGLTIVLAAGIGLLLAVTIRQVMRHRRLLDAELTEREARTRAIVDNAAEGIITIGERGIVESFNTAAENMFGYPADEVIGKSVNMLMPSPYREQHDRHIQSYLETGVKKIIGMRREVIGRRKDGSTFPMDLHVSDVRIGGRRLFTGIARDITRHKQAEEKITQQNRFLSTVLESLSHPFLVIDANDYSILLANTAARRDAPPQAETCHAMTHLRDTPCAGAEDRCPLVEVRETGKPAEAEHIHYQADGSPRVVEVHAHPVFDESKRVVQVIEYSLDVTERKRAEQELRKAHAESRHLLESISSVLISVDANDRVTAWNSTAERVFGIETKDAVGRLFNDLGLGWDHAAVARARSECRAKNRPVRIDEMRFKRPDGTEGFLGITLNPVGTGDDKHGGFLLIAADITEQKILQYQLAQAQKLESIGQLAAGIAHEINTPTQFVGDNTHFLQDAFQDLRGLLTRYAELAEAVRSGSVAPEILGEVDAAEKQADLDYLKDEIPQAITQSLEGIERVTRIVRAMKDFSHPGEREKAAVDLNKAIESTVTVARNEWKYVAEMVTDFDPALPPVVCLADDFNQVILNIVINAAHAIAGVVGDGAAGKGTITISTRRDGDWAEIRVRDTGTGIPEEHRSKVFDHFFTTKEVGKGTGQGLAIAHAVVTEKHGGTITFETEMGKGTTFIIRLPIELESATAEATPQHEEAHSLR